MAIIRPEFKRSDSRVVKARELSVGAEEIPFRPAYDLWERHKQKLSAEEAAAIGVALLNLLPAPHSKDNLWQIAGRIDALGQRL